MSNYTVKLDVPISVATEPELDWLVDFAKLQSEGLGVHDKTWFDPVTGTLMLRPEQFGSSHTPSPEALTFTTPAKWELVSVGTAANVYALSKDGTTEKVETTGSIAANTGLVFSFFCYGLSGVEGVYEAARLYFGEYTLIIYSNGYSYVERAGAATLSGPIVAGYGSHSGREALSNRWVKVLVLPMNRRDILIYSDAGGAWVYTRTDLALTATDNTIIAAGKAGFAFPDTKALCAVEQVSWPATGTYTTPLHDLGYAPKSTSTVTTACLSDGTVILALLDESGAAFTPDGSKTKVKLEFTFTDGAQAYAAAASFSGKVETRQGASRAVTHRGLTLGFDADMADDAQFNLDPMDDISNLNGWPAGMEAGGSVGVFDEADNELYLGLLGAPEIQGGQAPAGNAQASGLWKQLEQTTFRTDWRLDNMTLSDIVLKCLRTAGITDRSTPGSDGRVAISAYSSPAFAGDPRGKVTLFPIAAGSSAADALKTALDLWMPGDWVFTMRQMSGAQKVYFGPKPTGAPVKTFYRSYLKAGWGSCYWSNVKFSYSRAAGNGVAWNEVVVRGKDPDGTYLYASQAVTEAQNPETAEPERPADWFGAPVAKVYCDDRLCTQAQVDHVKDVLAARFLTRNKVATWWSDFDKTLSRGSIVTLEGHGSFRILDLRQKNKPIERQGRSYRPTEYVGEAV